jgi:hypothetical protein
LASLLSVALNLRPNNVDCRPSFSLLLMLLLLSFSTFLNFRDLGAAPRLCSDSELLMLGSFLAGRRSARTMTA